MISHRRMLNITALMPCRTIEIGGEKYLSRYFVGTFSDGRDLWLHQFHTGDGDKHHHDHPFDFHSSVLRGGYTEEFFRDGVITTRDRVPSPVPDCKIIRQIERAQSGGTPLLIPGVQMGKSHLHRIVKVKSNTWTMITVNPDREQHWRFIDDAGNIEYCNSSPRDWHNNFGPRK